MNGVRQINKVDSSNKCAVKFTISYARDSANFKIIFTFGGEIIKNAAHTEAMHKVLSTNGEAAK